MLLRRHAVFFFFFFLCVFASKRDNLLRSNLPLGDILLRGAGYFVTGSTREEHRCFATSARDWHRELDADLKAVQSLRQEWATRPDGPAAPLVLSAVERMR